jgi:hypothetical protein
MKFSAALLIGLGLMSVAQAVDCRVVCPHIYMPVCGVDGVTYGSACAATTCAGVEIAYNGECSNTLENLATLPCSLKCPRIPARDAVCGVDNVTYVSECYATRCVGVDVMHDGQCTQDDAPININPINLDVCFCPEIWNPVCGSDGQFYANDCKAACAGTDVAKRLGQDGNAADCN